MKNRKKIAFQVRQGDVLITRKVLDRGTLVARENGRIVLAHGEATGHAHAIRSDHAELYDLKEDHTAVGDAVWSHLVRCLRVNVTPASLEHEEHGTIVLPPGDYEVTRQMQYTPAESRPVQD